MPSPQYQSLPCSTAALDEAGIGKGLVRVPFGIEDWRDLRAHFETALDRI
jgi:cystathionine beta-lyase/cystathionine gamma-synthase